jgi:branched-chain amino acid aminotransferase
MSIRVHVGGQILPPEQARISVFDRGFLYGDSVFETLATAGGRLFAGSRHLDRLQRSAVALGIVFTQSTRSEIEAAVAATVAAAGNAETRVRIIISRGENVWGDLAPADAQKPAMVVIAGPRGGPTPEMYANGVGAAIVATERPQPRALDPAVKSSNYLPNVLALAEARRRFGPGVQEALLAAPGGAGVAEGASSNLFLVKDGEVRTPESTLILAGITRAFVLELCRKAGIPGVEVPPFAPQALRAADEVFVTSAIRGILPVTSIDGWSVGTGQPGPVSKRLMDLYADLQAKGDA